MPRKPRRIVPGLVYHLIARFVDREWFITTERERAFYLTLLGRAVQQCDWSCLAYAVMSNHIHLAVIAGKEKLDSWIRRVHAPFAEYMNKEHKRIGCIFTRGPKALPIPNDRAAHLIAYLHNNPVRAKVVEHPSQSSWTSHRAFIGLDPVPRWLDVERGLLLSARGSATDFDSWVASGPAHPLFSIVDPDRSYEDIIARYEEEQSALLGSVENEQSRDVSPELLQCAADTAGISTSQLLSRRRGKIEVLVRAVVVRCCDALGFTSAAIASALAITPPAVLWLRRMHGSRADVVALAERVMRRLYPERLIHTT
jgi:REP element-mobilizing transposase RayT